MVGQSQTDFANQIICRTEIYLDKLTDCVDLTEQIFGNYTAESPCEDLVADLRTRESECDELQRQICALITNTQGSEVTLQTTRLHINSSEVIELYHRLDEIANIAEQTARELVVTKPSRSGEGAYFEQFQQMATYATRAMAALDSAVTTFIRLICGSATSESIVDEIETIRAAEDECDELRTTITATVFADESIAQPLLYREFAGHLDELVDMIEDAVDQILLISTNEPWITTNDKTENSSPTDGREHESQ